MCSPSTCKDISLAPALQKNPNRYSQLSTQLDLESTKRQVASHIDEGFPWPGYLVWRPILDFHDQVIWSLKTPLILIGIFLWYPREKELEKGNFCFGQLTFAVAGKVISAAAVDDDDDLTMTIQSFADIWSQLCQSPALTEEQPLYRDPPDLQYHGSSCGIWPQRLRNY